MPTAIADLAGTAARHCWHVIVVAVLRPFAEPDPPYPYASIPHYPYARPARARGKIRKSRHLVQAGLRPFYCWRGWE